MRSWTFVTGHRKAIIITETEPRIVSRGLTKVSLACVSVLFDCVSRVYALSCITNRIRFVAIRLEKTWAL